MHLKSSEIATRPLWHFCKKGQTSRANSFEEFLETKVALASRLEANRFKVVGMRIEAFLNILDFTPLTILRPFAGPVFAFAKRFVVSNVKVLERSRNRNMSKLVNHTRSIWLTGPERITCGCNAIFQQSFHLSDLTRMHTNGVLHNAPMIGVTTSARRERTITRWYCLSA